MYFAQIYIIMCQQNTFTASTTILLCSNQVDLCEKFNAKIIRHGKDLVEAKERATKIAEEEGLLYVNG